MFNGNSSILNTGGDDRILQMDEAGIKIKPGECVWCRIESPQPGGYAVTVVSNGIKGFLPSTINIEIGKVVPSSFVCMNGDQALFTFAFTIGTSARVQHSTATDQENAFSVWAEAHPKSVSLRRAVDVFMPPTNSPLIEVKLNRQKSLEIFPTIEETKFTGCMKVYCESSMSRGALILLQGRVVGSVYTKKPIPDPYPFEIGIKKILEDVSATTACADLEMYELPEEIILSMAALFLGYVDKPAVKLENAEYAEKMLAHFADTNETACFNLLDEEADAVIALSFIHKGDFQGSYAIAQRAYRKEKEFLSRLIESNPKVRLQAHILPSALTTDAVRFGYSLNAEQFAIK